jgi:hypothetical protein
MAPHPYPYNSIPTIYYSTDCRTGRGLEKRDNNVLPEYDARELHRLDE